MWFVLEVRAMSLNAIEIAPEAGGTPTGVVVFLHGWGSNARDLATLAPMLNLSDYLYLCLDAPQPHPQVPGGKMWYDLNFDLTIEDRAGLADSRDRLCTWFDGLPERTGVPLSRTVLAGFSQGGAMTLDVGFRYPLAGLVAMSGYLHDEPPLSDAKPPVLVMHGTNDPVVPLASAQQVCDRLTQLGVAVDYREFPMAHEVCLPEIEALRAFVTAQIEPDSTST